DGEPGAMAGGDGRSAGGVLADVERGAAAAAGLPDDRGGEPAGGGCGWAARGGGDPAGRRD
ncbi:MAG: hypothetical protein SNJ59_15475, partial [Aggregatilineales bacterium]